MVDESSVPLVYQSSVVDESSVPLVDESSVLQVYENSVSLVDESSSTQFLGLSSFPYFAFDQSAIEFLFFHEWQN